MGRPVNKRYFGNRNVGSTTTKTDDGIGGKGVARIAISSVSTYQSQPTFTISAPQLGHGVNATGSIISEVLSATVDNGGVSGAYAVGDLLTISTPNGTATAYVSAVAADKVTSVNFSNAAASRGRFTDLPTAGVGIPALGNGNGEGCTLILTFRAKAVEITDPGSGYTATATTSGITYGVTLGAVTMTPDTTKPAGSALNPDPAIVAYAWHSGSVQKADVVRQLSAVRYRVITADTSDAFSARLITTGAPAADGEMTISATDSLGKTYYVAKLTAHKVLLVPYGASGHEFPLNADSTPNHAKWSFGGATASYSVTIENA